MKQLFVLGFVVLLAVANSGCATRGYARRQAAPVNDRADQLQTQVAALAAKQETDVARADERITANDNKVQELTASAAQANTTAGQANARAALAEANAAQANAIVARAMTSDNQEGTVVAVVTPPPSPTSSETAGRSKHPTTLPSTGSELPLIALSGLFSLGAAGALRLFSR